MSLVSLLHCPRLLYLLQIVFLVFIKLYIGMLEKILIKNIISGKNFWNVFERCILVFSFLNMVPEDAKSSFQSSESGYDTYLRDAFKQVNFV